MKIESRMGVEKKMLVTDHELSCIEAFRGVSPGTYQYLKDHGKVCEYNSGHKLLQDRQEADCIYLILSGSVSVYKINDSGLKRVFFILGAGKAVNEECLQGLPSSVCAEVFENVRILRYEKLKILKLMETDFRLCQNFFDSLARKTRRLYRQLNNSSPSLKIEKRLAAKIWKLCKDHGKEEDGLTAITIPISITYLADLLGAQRETVSRAMKALVTKEYVTYQNKRIYVNNPDDLVKFFKAL